MKNRFSHLLIFLIALPISHPVQVTAKVNSSIGPFEIFSADSASSIRLQFAGQLRLIYDSRDNGPDAARTEKLSMQARRIRLTLAGTVYNANLSYRLHLSTAPKSLELMDFYFDYKFRPYLQFRFGQYKTPFTRSRIQSFQRLAFVDWAIVTKYFGAERQMGFAFHNGYEQPPKYGYIVGVFSGANARASHAIGLSDVYGEKVFNPSDLANPGTTDKFHPELFFHITYNANNIKINSSSDEAKTGLRYSLGMSSAWDLFPTEYHDFSLRFAPELLVKYRGLSFLAAGYVGYSKIGDPAKNKPAMTGGLFQTAYRINSRFEISARYAIVGFKDRLTDDARERAMQLIADSGNDPDVIEQYENAGQILQEQELTTGFNIYISGHSLKWQNDIGWLKHFFIDENRDDYQIRSQFQVSF